MDLVSMTDFAKSAPITKAEPKVTRKVSGTERSGGAGYRRYDGELLAVWNHIHGKGGSDV